MNTLSTHLFYFNNPVSPTMCTAVSIAPLLFFYYLFLEVNKLKKLKKQQSSIHEKLNELSIRVYNISEELDAINRYTNTEQLIINAFSPQTFTENKNLKSKWQEILDIVEKENIDSITTMENRFPILDYVEIQHFILSNNGFTQKEIAEILGISIDELPIRWFKICEKLNMNTEILNVEVSYN